MAAERKGKKLRRVEPNRGYYKSQFGITDRNEKLKHGRHIRHFPEDLAARQKYDEKHRSSQAANEAGRAVSMELLIKLLRERAQWYRDPVIAEAADELERLTRGKSDERQDGAFDLRWPQGCAEGQDRARAANAAGLHGAVRPARARAPERVHDADA
jgi:hypothetical protein